jgi:hypothetical protein
MMHTFHIPVMGTCYTADTPIRLAPLGINSVISLVDDLLLERLRSYYAKEYRLPYEPIPHDDEDGRAHRITAYLNLLNTIVQNKFVTIQKLPFGKKNEKDRYFTLLPDSNPLRARYFQMLELPENAERRALEKELTEAMKPGSIDVNIMVKLDRIPLNAAGEAYPEEFSDAKAALRGYALSDLEDSSIVFSAGINQSLYNYVSKFRDFYRDTSGEIKKKIIVKISDFRSALIQGKFLARKGLEVSEYRIESGLNCGGHAFASQGQLLPTLLREIQEKRDSLVDQFKSSIEKYYNLMGWDCCCLMKERRPRLTVQGGIGTSGEDQRMRETYGMDGTGWGSPFLLVREASLLDDETRRQLAEATEKELFLSHASPLGVPFNNMHTCGSEVARLANVAKGTPGMPCFKGFLQNNTEFTEHPICPASHQYQKLKTEQINAMNISEKEKSTMLERIYERACICHQLGNSGLIALGLAKAEKAPQAVCPGPNIAYFDREYSLEEMVDHIYGRAPSLVSENRPHMFAQEIRIYTNWYKEEVERFDGNPDYGKWLDTAAANLYESMDYCLTIAQDKAYPNENLASIVTAVNTYRPEIEKARATLSMKMVAVA